MHPLCLLKHVFLNEVLNLCRWPLLYYLAIVQNIVNQLSVSGALTVSQKAKNCQSERQKLSVRTPLTENERQTNEQESHANHL